MIFTNASPEAVAKHSDTETALKALETCFECVYCGERVDLTRPGFPRFHVDRQGQPHFFLVHSACDQGSRAAMLALYQRHPEFRP